MCTTDSCVKSVSFACRCAAVVPRAAPTHACSATDEAFGGISAVPTIAAMPPIEKINKPTSRLAPNRVSAHARTRRDMCALLHKVRSCLCLLAACTCWAHDRGIGSHSGHQAVSESEGRGVMNLMLCTAAEYSLVILIYSLPIHAPILSPHLSLSLLSNHFFFSPTTHLKICVFSALTQSRSNPVSLSRWWRRGLPLFRPRNL
ncbi:hypothetical protein J3F84DRAFT_386541 [Trichoderma pleuroticola]